MQRKPLNPRLNRKHPHAAGLMAAWVFDRPGNVLREAVSNLQIATQTGTFEASRTGWGPAGRWATAGATDTFAYGDVLDRSLLSPFSIFAVAQPAGSAAQTIVARSGLVGGIDNGFEFKLFWSAGAFGLFRSDGTTPQLALTAASYPAGFVYRVAATFDGTTCKVFVDGVLAATAGSPVSVSTTSPQITIASQWVPNGTTYNSQFTGQIFGLWISKVAAGHGVVSSFSADPWGMFRRRPLQVRRLTVDVVDTTAPTVALVSPAEGPIAPSTAVVIDITSAAGTALAALSVAFLVCGAEVSVDQVWSTSRGFTAEYEDGSSTTAVSATVTRVTMLRKGNWPQGGLSFRPDVVSSAGVVNV